MISHQTLYSLANAMGFCAVLTVLAYHFVTVNGRALQSHAQKA